MLDAWHVQGVQVSGQYQLFNLIKKEQRAKPGYNYNYRKHGSCQWSLITTAIETKAKLLNIENNFQETNLLLKEICNLIFLGVLD